MPPTSYAFSIRAATKTEASEAVAAELANAVAAQPLNAASQSQAQAAADSYIQLVRDDLTQDITVSMNGWVRTVEAGLEQASVTVTVALVAKL
jgi:hypothetical protein